MTGSVDLIDEQEDRPPDGNNIVLVESGMKFGPFPKNKCFLVEKSDIYATMQNGVKVVEFILVSNNGAKEIVSFVEAKSSSPRPENAQDFDDYINDIKQKMMNAFALFLGVKIGRHNDATKHLPEDFVSLDIAKASFKFILVIKGHKEEWLAPISDALNQFFAGMMRSFNDRSGTCIAINDDIARQYNLVS